MLYNNTVMERIDDLQYENLKIIQNPEWFCFGVDSVLLTEFARDIKRNSRIIDLGTGTGILSILMSKKVNAQKIVGVELQEDVAEMATRSVKINGLENIISIVRSDLKDLEFENNSFDVVITNPPYKKAGTGILQSGHGTGGPGSLGQAAGAGMGRDGSGLPHHRDSS